MAIEDPVIAQIQLGILLRELRDAAQFTLAEAGEHAVLSGPSLSKVENGKQGISPDKVATLLELYGADDHVSAEALKLASVPKSRTRRRGSLYRDSIPAIGKRFLALEADATEVWVYENEVINGRLQIADYARTLMQATTPAAGSREIDRKVQTRLARQEQLTSRADAPLQLNLIQHEATLHRVIGGDQVMAAQLRHLAEVSTLQNIRLHVLPFRPKSTPNFDEAFVTQSSFTLLKLPERGTLLYIEDFVSATYPEDIAVIQKYVAAYQRLSAAAEDTESSRELIVKVAEQYDAPAAKGTRSR